MTTKEAMLELETLINLVNGNKVQQPLPSFRDNVDYLRICIISMLHDLESTRRELKEARKE